MTVRRRIILAALAVGVVGILGTLIWAASSEETVPKISFSLSRDPNHLSRAPNAGTELAIINVTNCGVHTVSLRDWGLDYAGREIVPLYSPSCNQFTVRGSNSFQLPFVTPPEFSYRFTVLPWHVWCAVERETWSNKLRRKIRNLPLVGSALGKPHRYYISGHVSAVEFYSFHEPPPTNLIEGPKPDFN